MDIKEIKNTAIWSLYEKGRNYHRMTSIYVDTDRNYRMYNGNQWEHAKLGDVEPVQKNFIKPIVKYKVGVIHNNLYAVNYSSQNFENKEFRQEAEKICEMLNKKAARIWEKDKMDYVGRKITKDAAINDEGIIYVNYDIEKQMPINEIVKKNDIYYGNENDEDIQGQPYILIRKRMPVANAMEMAREEGLSEDKLAFIIGDNDTFEESGEAAKLEIDNMVTVITKMWREKGTVHFSVATRWIDIKKDKDSGLTYYPVAHYLWEEKEGSARGEGEVRTLIPNQIEVNRTEVRRVLTVKYQAYPQKIANIETGQVNPEDASGRAILAVQQASQSPMTEQRESFKNFVEDLARIWLDMFIVYSKDGIKLEKEVTDPQTGEIITELVDVSQTQLKELQATVKVDITPKGAFDKYAQEQSIENMFQAGMFNAEKLPELKTYVRLLDDDSVMPKQKLEDAIKIIEEEQQKIAMMNAEAQLMKQRANQFLMGDPEVQGGQMADAQMQMAGEQEVLPEDEAETIEENPDDN